MYAFGLFFDPRFVGWDMDMTYHHDLNCCCYHDLTLLSQGPKELNTRHRGVPQSLLVGTFGIGQATSRQIPSSAGQPLVRDSP